MAKIKRESSKSGLRQTIITIRRLLIIAGPEMRPFIYFSLGLGVLTVVMTVIALGYAAAVFFSIFGLTYNRVVIYDMNNTIANPYIICPRDGDNLKYSLNVNFRNTGFIERFEQVSNAKTLQIMFSRQIPQSPFIYINENRNLINITVQRGLLPLPNGEYVYTSIARHQFGVNTYDVRFEVDCP